MVSKLQTQTPLSSLCFGTATFVKGKLNSEKDSSTGIQTLEYALRSGINSINSNPNLETQWAIKAVLNNNPIIAETVHQFIKIEIPLEAEYKKIVHTFTERIERSLSELNTSKIFCAIYETDTKRTAPNKLADYSFMHNNYTMIRQIANEYIIQDKLELLACMNKKKDELSLAIDSRCFDLYAGYFNLFDIWPTYFFDIIKNENKGFIGIQLLKHGIFTESLNSKNSSVYRSQLINMMGEAYPKILEWCNKQKNNRTIQELALGFTLTNPVVKTNIIGLSQLEHLNQVLTTPPLSTEEFFNICDQIAYIQGSTHENTRA